MAAGDSILLAELGYTADSFAGSADLVSKLLLIHRRSSIFRFLGFR